MNEAPFPEGMIEDIEKFFALESTRKPGLDLYPSVFETALFFPLQRQAELAEMMREARRVNPRVVMEIGADKGGGLYHWCKCLETVKTVMAAEIRGTPYDRIFERNFPDIEFVWFKNSRPTFLIDTDRLDCLFIDGDKSSFVADFISYRPFMSESGVVFMHDIKDPGPTRDAFLWAKKQGYRTREIINVSDTHRALRLADMGRPPANAHEGWLRHWKGKSAGVGVIYMPEHPGPEVR